jgi:hypothetical protein
MAVTMTFYVTWSKSGHCNQQDDVTHEKYRIYFPLQASKVPFVLEDKYICFKQDGFKLNSFFFQLALQPVVGLYFAAL